MRVPALLKSEHLKHSSVVGSSLMLVVHAFNPTSLDVEGGVIVYIYTASLWHSCFVNLAMASFQQLNSADISLVGRGPTIAFSLVDRK